MRRVAYSAMLCLLAGCKDAAPKTSGSADVPRMANAPAADGKLFTIMPSAYTGVRFENRIVETDSLNVFVYRNFYNGGGVAIGDLNGDGMPEIVLGSNLNGPKIFLNESKFRFRDITAEAGLGKHKLWTTGITLADVNGDGKLDIYISHAGTGDAASRRNELWINDGTGPDSIPKFTERAAEYGVADDGFTTQAAFFDYDHDGDLDLIVINNSPRPASSFGMRNTRNERDHNGGDRLYRNDNGHFTDVSEKAGIFAPEMAFGLGLSVADINHDGWPDIYISNDFFEHDYVYINNRDGTFTESMQKVMPNSSYFSMGMDVADVDNDGMPDIYTTDMMPEDEYRLRTTSSFDGWDVYQAKLRNDYGHQFMRNMLQHSNQDGTFSDVGQMAGVSRTDWSWSALLEDMDLDGRKDIFVTNGLLRDLTSQEYLSFLANTETIKQVRAKGKIDYVGLTKAMTSTPIPDYAFRNDGGLHFSNQAKAWGLDTPNISSGAAFGDLDGDGAPDLVVNNANLEAFVYRNNARTVLPANHFLQVSLVGTGMNRFALGSHVTLWTGAEQIVQELSPTRGFQSSTDYTLTFGVGARDTVDSLTVDWPDGRRTTRVKQATNTKVTLKYADAPATPRGASAPDAAGFLADVTRTAAITFVHKEDDFTDFDRERLIPKMLSIEGPGMAVGDVNGDGLDDVYIGGAKEQAGQLWLQRADGTFAPSNPGVFEPDAISEDVGAIFFDANGDKFPDLYVVSGGNAFAADAPALQDRLYLNDGKGNFRKATDALPTEGNSGSRVTAIDYDGDGDLDLFVGSRSVPWRYGYDPVSMLLRNDGKGHFTNVTAQLAPGLVNVGMVTDAVWQDVDRDGRPDLIVVGDWMPITIFHNAGGGRLTKITVKGLDHSTGWWNRIIAGDFTGDGKVDFVVGNLGYNSRLHASVAEPTTMLVKDFDGNGAADQIVACYTQGKNYPIVLRDEMIKALPPLKVRFLSYEGYAKATLDDMFPPADRGDAVQKKAETFATSLVRNNGDGSFTLVPLPDEAQVAPIFGILATDVDGDGITDLVLGGNFDGFKPDIARTSDSYGLVLRGSKTGTFTALSHRASGFFAPGQTRDIQRLRSKGGELLLVARNNDRPLVFRSNHSAK